MAESTGDVAVDAALADLARTDRGLADVARSAFASLTWGEGLASVTAHGLADFLWYQLPVKWICDLAEKQQVATALADLFKRLGQTRYAAMCASSTTAEVLIAYEHDGDAAGLKAYRAALAATGVQPPSIPGVIEWGPLMGTDEAGAYGAASSALEAAIDAGAIKPGRAGWRRAAERTVSSVLASPRDELTGSTWLQWVHTERLQGWAESGAGHRQRLAGAVANRLIHPTAVPDTAEEHLASLRWLLDHAAAGAALTPRGNLARPIVVDGCQRFDWHTVTGTPRSESDIVELWTLRDLAKQLGVVRRTGRKLQLSTLGKAVHAMDAAGLWHATMASLLGPGEVETAAGEMALLLLVTMPDADEEEIDVAVAAALSDEGWRNERTGEPATADHVSGLLDDLRRRLSLLQLADWKFFGEPVRLNDAGRLAAYAALRSRALRPRTQPYH